MSGFQKPGIFFCLIIIASCFLNWAWYPDLEKYFTAFFSEKNYYGKPGKLIIFFAVSGIVFYLINKPWSQRLNLIFCALNMAFAVRTFLLYTSGYDGYVPEAQWGIYLLLAACGGHAFIAAASMVVVKKKADAVTEVSA